MARKKLSESQRAAIRKEIRRRLDAGASKTSVGRDLSRKYGVSTVTIRWYVKSIQGDAVLPARSRTTMRILDIVRNVSEEGLARALAARKLFVQLQAKLAESEKLRRTRERVDASARKLEKKLQKLTVR